MADAPATTPAAAPVAAPAAAPASPPIVPAGGTTAQRPTTATAPVAGPPEIDFDTPLEYDDGKGGFKRATYGELIKAHEKVSSMTNLDQMNDLAAALNNDPDATERVLKRQLADIEAAKAKNTPQGSAEVVALRQELAEIKSLLTESSSVTKSIKAREEEAILENLLSKPGVREKLPYLSVKPTNGARIAHRVVEAVKAQVKAAGLQWDNSHLIRALGIAEQQHRAMLEPYGIDPAKFITAPAGTAVSAVNNGPAANPNVVREPLETPEMLLRNRGQLAPVHQNAPIGGTIPEAGGAIGGAPTGGPAVPTRYGSQGLVDKIKARSAAGGGA